MQLLLTLVKITALAVLSMDAVKVKHSSLVVAESHHSLMAVAVGVDGALAVL